MVATWRSVVARLIRSFEAPRSPLERARVSSPEPPRRERRDSSDNAGDELHRVRDWRGARARRGAPGLRFAPVASSPLGRPDRGRHRVALAALPTAAELEAAQLATIAGFGVIIGGFAVALGLKGEPEPCPACAQRGGEECIFCDGTGRREAPVEITRKERNDDSVLGLTRRSPLECTACKGAGMILCKTCRGTGFVK